MVRLFTTYKDETVEVKEINLRVNGFAYIKYKDGKEIKVLTRDLVGFTFYTSCEKDGI